MELGITGHTTRGDEVIKILETLGGKNCCYRLTGYNDKYFYYISYEYKYICNSYIGPDEIKGYKIFSLEDFLEKFPYKVGDKVNIYAQKDDIEGGFYIEVAEITSMRWDPTHCRIVYKMEDIDREFCVEDIRDKVDDDSNKQYNKPKSYAVGLKDDKVNDEEEEQIDPTIDYYEIMLNDFYDGLKKQAIENIMDTLYKDGTTHDFLKERGFNLPEGYHFTDENGNVIEAKKILLVKNAPSYPKTYEECCDVIGINRHEVEIDIPHPYQQNMFNLFKLLICKDAYWKIAGEYLELDKPWEPDWTNENQPKYGLYDELKYSIINPSQFVFPTEEMREYFYKNFKNLIEQCKELL